MYLDQLGTFSHFLLYVAIRIEINKITVSLSVLGLHSVLYRWAVKQNKFTWRDFKYDQVFTLMK